MGSTMPADYPYCARYCEENIWRLAQHADFAGAERVVAVISNGEQACLFWDQRACVDPNLPVWWDYHVILLVNQGEWHICDLDTALPLPVEAGAYLHRTFRLQERMPEEIRPRFLLLPGDAYVSEFASDRSHMRDDQGNWLSPPPDWPAIKPGCGEGFTTFLARQFKAELPIAFDDMCARFGGPIP